MSYIGNQPSTTAFLTDTFNGTGAQLNFTMAVAPANTTSMLVAVSGVVQDPSTYSIIGTTLTFSAPPPSGTGNVSVRYLGIPASGVTNTAYRTVTNFTATASQTSFTVPSYTVGYIDVYRNGVRLAAADYTASTGTTVVLANGCTLNDVVTTESFYVSSVLNAIPATAGAINSTYLSSGLTLTTPTLTSPTITSPSISGTAVMGTSLITSGTAVASTSGTSIDFTSIPSWVKRITVMFSGVSTTGGSNFVWQLGSGSIDTTANYSYSRSQSQHLGTLNITNSTTSVNGEFMGNWSSGATLAGHLVFTNISGNTWISSSNVQHVSSVTGMSLAVGSKTLSGVLDRVRITAANGTDTFDAGSINILYE